MLRFIFIVLVLFANSAFADCVSARKFIKCAKLPESSDWSFYSFSNFSYGADGLSWSLVYKDRVVVTGTSSGGGRFEDVYCNITYPFYGSYMVPYEPSFMLASFSAQVCTDEIMGVGVDSFFVEALDGDKCPDGFYTVPHDMSCGENMIDVAGVPMCDDDVSGEFCVIEGVAVTPCASGITRLRAGNGVSVPLWSEKTTEHAIGVMYNGVTCWGNLEEGRASSGGNIRYGDYFYHLVD